MRPTARLVFASALLLATAAASSAFESDTLYRYEFEGAISSKVADQEQAQYAGMALRSPLLLKRSGRDELTIRLERPESALFNQLMDNIHTHKFDYKPLSQDIGLDKAFRIYFEDGGAKAFDSHKDEPKWVTNFKRGLLSFFQLRLTQPDSSGADSGQYYTSSEKSVFGECETDYLILDSGSEGAAADQDTSGAAASQLFNVTKTRNMSRCKSKFNLRFFPVDSSECYENEKDLHQYKHSNSIFQYQLAGSRQKYVIKQVLLDETATFSPFGPRAHSHAINSKFIMRLATSNGGQQSAGDELLKLEEANLQRLESLSYDPPEMVNFYANINLEQEHHLSNIYQSSASVEQVVEAFESLVQEHRGQTAAFEQQPGGAGPQQEQSKLASAFMRLNELIGTMNFAKIEQLYGQLDERGEAHKKIFWDLMSVTGTNPSFVFMKRLIADGDAPSVKIRDFLGRLSFHIKQPSKSLFDEYVNLCKSDKIQANQQYKRLCSLPLASLIHQHCAKPHAKYLRLQQEGGQAASAYKKAQNTCQIATAEEYFSRLVAPIVSSPPGNSSAGVSAGSSTGAGSSAGSTGSGSSSSSSGSSAASSSGASSGSSGGAGPSAGGGSGGAGEGEQTMALGEKMFNIKLAGELGVRPSLDYLVAVAKNRDEHPSLRSAAMWQLAKVAYIYPNATRRATVPFFYDTNELLELRIAALLNWLEAGMTLHEMETMAKQLMLEPSGQLVSYVHSLFKSLSKLKPVGCSHAAYEKYARLVLPTIKRAHARHSTGAAGGQSTPGSWLSSSQASMSSSWSQEFGFGSTSLMSVIFANDSMAPTNVHYSSSEIMAGLRLTPMSVSLQAHGLDKLLKRVAGIKGLLADKESFMDVFSLKRRSKRQAQADLIKQEADEIDKELKLATRDFSDVYISLTISVYGRPLTFIDRDSRELKKMLSDDGTIKIPQIKKLLHSFNNYTQQQMMIAFEKLELFNNELGLPLYQSISDFEYKTFKLNGLKLDVEPGFFRDERQGRPPTRLTAALDLKLGRHNEMLVSSGAIALPHKQLAGAGFHKRKLLNYPLKLTLDANLLASQLTLKRASTFDNVLYIKQTPITHLHSFDPTSAATDQLLPLFAFNDSAQMRPFKLEYMTPLALGLRLEGRHRAGQDWSMAAWRRYLSAVGPTAAKFMYFNSPTGAPLEATLSTVTTADNPTRELTQTFTWRHHHYQDDGAAAAAGAATASSELNDIERELEQSVAAASKQPEGARPSTVSYKLALTGGTSKERRASIELAYSRSADRLLHKWRAFYSRTPLDDQSAGSGSSSSAEVTNLCWLGQMQFPRHQMQQLLALDLLQLDHSANLTSELTFGDECQESKTAAATARVSADVKFDWSQAQRAAIERVLAPAAESPNWEPADESAKQFEANMRRLHSQCLSARQLYGAKLDPSCVDFLRRAGELTHVAAHFDYKDVPERWTHLVRRLGSLYTYARAGYIDEMDDRPSGAGGAANLKPQSSSSSSAGGGGGQRDRAHLEANMTLGPAGQTYDHAQSMAAGPGYDFESQSAERRLSYQFNTNNYHVVYRNLPVGFPPLSTSPLLGSTYYQQLQAASASVNCMVNSQLVTTFDNYTYRMPQVGDGCFKLITKDCSAENNFVVLGAKVGATGKVVKVYIGQKFKVEFVPDKDGTRISDIKVNGDTAHIQFGGPALRREIKMGPRTLEAFSIDFNGAYYTLQSKLYKFSVSTDGTWIHVQQSKYYAGKSCGICGDANGDHLFEFKSPVSAKQICKNAADFVWAHVIPSTCAARPTTIECA